MSKRELIAVLAEQWGLEVLFEQPVVGQVVQPVLDLPVELTIGVELVSEGWCFEPVGVLVEGWVE